MFGGPAERVTEAIGRSSQWYLHQFAIEQPDLDWSSPEVLAMFEDVRTWLARGVDGFHDAANALVKDLSSVDRPGDDGLARRSGQATTRSRTRGARGLPLVAGDRTAGPTPDPAARSTRRPSSDSRATSAPRAHGAQLPVPARRLGRGRLRTDNTLAALGAVGAAPTWVLSNHDETRHVTRYGRARTGIEDRTPEDPPAWAVDLDLGTRRARDRVFAGGASGSASAASGPGAGGAGTA